MDAACFATTTWPLQAAALASSRPPPPSTNMNLGRVEAARERVELDVQRHVDRARGGRRRVLVGAPHVDQDPVAGLQELGRRLGGHGLELLAAQVLVALFFRLVGWWGFCLRSRRDDELRRAVFVRPPAHAYRARHTTHPRNTTTLSCPQNKNTHRAPAGDKLGLRRCCARHHRRTLPPDAQTRQNSCCRGARPAVARALVVNLTSIVNGSN
jgi:hypothetical protein